jgi:K+ transporter
MFYPIVLPIRIPFFGIFGFFHSLNINKLKYTGERWAKLLIKNIWQIMLQLWQTRNEIIYQEDSTIAWEQQIDKLRTRVVRCYELKHKLKANERQQWFGTNLAEKLCEDYRMTTKNINKSSRTETTLSTPTTDLQTLQIRRPLIHLGA